MNSIEIALLISCISLLVTIVNSLIIFLTFIRDKTDIKLNIEDYGEEIFVTAYNSGKRPRAIVATKFTYEFKSNRTAKDALYNRILGSEPQILAEGLPALTRVYVLKNSLKLRSIKFVEFMLIDGTGKKHIIKRKF